MANITLNMDSLKQRREFVRHPVNPGHNIYRILPPFGPVDNHNNYPFKRWTLAWMIDPKTGRRRPFAMPPYDKEAPDCVSKYTKLLADRIEEIKAEVKDGTMPPEEGKATMRALNEIIMNIRPKSTYLYNAVNKAGVVGILELKKTAHDSLKKAMFQYIQDYSQDPTSLLSQDDDSGVWFNVIREGEKGDKETKYSVEKCQKKVKLPTGKITFEDDRDPIPEHIVESYDQVGYDIYNMYKVNTNEEVMEILLYNIAKLAETVPEAVVPGFEPELSGEEEVPAAKPAVKKPAVAKVAITMDEVDEDDIPPARTPAKVQAKVPAKPVKQTTPVVTADDDDFMSMADSLLS